MALGSNLGARESNLVAAIVCLLPLIDAPLLAPPFETRAVPAGSGPDYLNTALTGSCRLPPDALLAEIKRIELGLGRESRERNAPRLIDIDLLLYGMTVASDPELTLPHPRMHERRFVLEPLSRIAPSWEVPPGRRRVADLLAGLGPGTGVLQRSWTQDPLADA